MSGSLVFLAGLVAAGGHAATAAAASQDTAPVLAAGEPVRIDAPAGVAVRGVDSGRIRVARPNGEDVSIRRADEGWIVEVGNEMEGAALEIEIPARSPLRVLTDRGDLAVRGMRANVAADAGRGSIHIASVVGDVEAVTSGGSLRVEDVVGNVTARAHIDHVRIARVRGDVTAVNVTAHLLLRDIDGAIDAENLNGETRYCGALRPSTRHRFVTHVGQVILRLPPDASVAVRAEMDPGAFAMVGFRGPRPVVRGRELSVAIGDPARRAGVDVRSFRGALTIAAQRADTPADRACQ